MADNVKGLLCGSMRNWKSVLTSNEEVLGEVRIKRGIFQGDSLSSLLFVLSMIPLTIFLKRENIGYKFGKEQKMTNHLLYMDDLKLYDRSEQELESLIDVVRVFSRDIGMEFGLEKYAVLVLKQGIKVRCEGIVLPGGQMMGEVDENGYKYLGVLEGADIMQKKMKEKVRKEYMKRVKLVAKSKLYGGNLIKAIKAWAIGVVRYSAGILDWSDRELKVMDVKMDVKTRKRLTMFGAFHKKGSVPRLYMKRKDDGRGLISVFDCVKLEELALSEYIKETEEWMLKVVGETLHVGEMKNEYKKRVEKTRMECFLVKRLHGKFMRDVSKVADARSWQWLRAGYLVKGTEVESVGPVACGCSGLAQREYRRRHDHMGLRVYWELCRKYDIKSADVWYKEVPDEVRMSEDGKVEIWWVDFTVPWDKNVVSKEDEKIYNYSPLVKEITKLHRVSAKVVPLVVGCLGVVSCRLEQYLKELGIPDVLGGMQTSAVVGTTQILQKILGL